MSQLAVSSRSASPWSRALVSHCSAGFLDIRTRVCASAPPLDSELTQCAIHGVFHIKQSLSSLIAAAAKSLQLCPTLCDPIDGSPQALPSLGFSRQKHQSGLPFPSPTRESEAVQSCPTLHDPMDCSPPGSSVQGIFQARVLEWVAISSLIS